ncbi:MAG: hypothetical protein K1W26_05045 [Acetatifactor sp.]
MRKQNSEFLTAFTSEASHDIKNTDYFGYVELDDCACYVIADGIDDQLEALSARLAVTAATSAFLESPSMSRRTVKRCLRAANKALLEAKSKTRLKASVILVLTDYVKLRYGQAGNIRLRLYRDGFLCHGTTDQSLTLDMVKEERVSQDRVAAHIERNNLYAYLGQEKDFHPVVSKKIKLTDSDVLTLYTRGVWEHVDEGEIRDVVAEAAKDPAETVNSIEDMLLSRQPEDLHKYTLAVIYFNKLFADPGKKRKIRRILLLLIPVLLAAATLAVLLLARHNKRMEKQERMELGYTDTIEYIQMDNYTKAQETCEAACELADELKDRQMQTELGDLMKLVEAVLRGQQLLEEEKYTEAQEAFLEASKRAEYVDRLGADYIGRRLELTASYISVYDLIYLGDSLTENLQYDRAEEKYLEAKALASKIYFDNGRTDAMDALDDLYQAQRELRQEEDEARKEQLTQEDAGNSLLAQGDTAYAQGDYESAKVYYSSALQKFRQLQDEVQLEVLTGKLDIVERKLAENEKLETEAEGYLRQAEILTVAGDYNSARKYYLLAKDIYAAMKEDDKLAEISRKMELLSIKEESLPPAPTPAPSLP